MFIYNVTIKVHWGIHEGWLWWMQQVHMPEVIETGCFSESRLLRLLETDDSDGPTYAAQYYTETIEAYNRYISEFAPELRKKISEKWGVEMIAFRTLMQVVQ